MNEKDQEELKNAVQRLSVIWPKIDALAKRELLGTMNGVAIATAAAAMDKAT